MDEKTQFEILMETMTLYKGNQQALTLLIGGLSMEQLFNAYANELSRLGISSHDANRLMNGLIAIRLKLELDISALHGRLTHDLWEKILTPEQLALADKAIMDIADDDTKGE